MSVGGGALRGGHHLLKDFSITTESKVMELSLNKKCGKKVTEVSYRIVRL